MESKIANFTRVFFWFGFSVFLLASIPHIATYFRHFDPNATPGSFEDISSWLISYLIAIVIDVTDVLVSVTVMKEMANGKNVWQLAGYWVFIVFIMALSWFINWQYNIAFETNAFAVADSKVFLLTTVGAINPIVGSAFQLLLFVYTSMAHKLTAKEVVKTAAQLKDEADELEAMAIQKSRVNAVKNAQNKEKIGGLFGLGKQVLSEAQKMVEKQKDKVGNLETIEIGNEEETVEDTQRIQERNDIGYNDESSEDTTEKLRGNEGETSEDTWMKRHYPDSASWVDARGTTVSLKEVARTTKHAMKRLGNCVDRKEIRATKPRGNGEVMVNKTSVIAWMIQERNGRGNMKLIPFKTVRNTDQLAVVNDEETAEEM